MKGDWAWDGEPEVVPEDLFTPVHKFSTSGQWTAWNGHSAELEFCEWVGSLARLVKPELTIETGVGQGFTTRRLPCQIRLVGFENNPKMRQRLMDEPFWKEPHHTLSPMYTPTPADMSLADLTILDSKMDLRLAEIELWAANASNGALLVVHDAGLEHHSRLTKWIHRCGISGVTLDHPRGSFLGQR